MLPSLPWPSMPLQWGIAMAKCDVHGRTQQDARCAASAGCPRMVHRHKLPTKRIESYNLAYTRIQFIHTKQEKDCVMHAKDCVISSWEARNLWSWFTEKQSKKQFSFSHNSKIVGNIHPFSSSSSNHRWKPGVEMPQQGIVPTNQIKTQLIVRKRAHFPKHTG